MWSIVCYGSQQLDVYTYTQESQASTGWMRVEQACNPASGVSDLVVQLRSEVRIIVVGVRQGACRYSLQLASALYVEINALSTIIQQVVELL